ncbi:MAG: hypothetical protein ACAH80_05700 [Alphaproteobacteria bacterium]
MKNNTSDTVKAFNRFMGKPTTASTKITYPEREVQKIAHVKNYFMGWETTVAGWVAGQGLVMHEQRPVYADVDIVVGTEKKRHRQTALEFNGRAIAGIEREAAKQGLHVSYMPEGYVRWGMNYDPTRLTVDLQKQGSGENAYRVKGFRLG